MSISPVHEAGGQEYTRARSYFPNFIGVALWNTDWREIGLKARVSF